MRKILQSKLGRKISAIVGILLLLVAIINLGFMYYSIKTTATQSISEFTTLNAENISKHFDGEAYERFLTNQSESNDYWDLRNQLNDFREKTGALYVYTMEVTNDKKVKILIDGQLKDSKNASEIGESTASNTYSQVGTVLNGELAHTDINHDPEYGDYVSAFAPIKNKDGKIIGILGVDTSAKKVTSIVNHDIEQLGTIFFVLIIVISVIASAMVFLYLAKLMQPLNILNRAFSLATTGKLREGKQLLNEIRLKQKDEISHLHKSSLEMFQGITEILNKVTESSQQLASSSEQLYASVQEATAASEHVSGSIQKVSDGTGKQTKDIAYSEESLSKVGNEVEKINSETAKVKDITVSANDYAAVGSSDIRKVVEQMSSIQQSVEDTNNKVQSLNQSSLQIGKIIEIITQIAEQTNLLALNAAIESARAGESGKGFAVVAGEVRKLAEQTQESAKQIGGFIHMMQQDAEDSVKLMNHVSENVEAGVQLTMESENKFKNIQSQVEQISNRMEELSSIAAEISTGTEKISTISSEITHQATENSKLSDEVAAATDEQLASMQEISSSTHHLSNLAEELQALVKRFEL
ncbi:methyl-accepting chemotaxis protein [Bacillus sp. FJAT-49736]|uniref:methyl-accepting chemotaxis protein n=1 Tax=Bacillus sp. FJAT-49736 TaxID=2833582 RepID=UPI001BCA14E8|nr:methyl-accepting chemotaxis protein [Bacillus sp. FJAT-49736]MBS4174278.1 hypothetical protein [Bacillus sp. FJAT-49736]